MTMYQATKIAQKEVIRKQTYAEMLKELDPNAVMPGGGAELMFPYITTGSKRPRQQNQPSTSRESPSRKKTRSNESQNQPPPGFKNQNNKEEEDNEITIFITSFINELGLPPFICQLVIKFIVPFINKLVGNSTNSFMEKMSSIVSQ